MFTYVFISRDKKFTVKLRPFSTQGLHLSESESVIGKRKKEKATNAL